MLVAVTVGDVMQAPVITAKPDASIGAVVALSDEHDVGSVVIEADERPVGIVTESTIVDWFLAGTDREMAVGEVMTAPVVTTEVDVPIESAAERMGEHEVSTLPVCGDDGRLVGIVTMTDLSNYLPEIRLRPGPGPDRSKHRRDGRPDTAYEHEEWRFERYGENEGAIDVGDVVTFEKSLSPDDVAAFAEASGDTNRLHLDADYARATRFGRRIAHGTLVCGVISAALARLPGLIVYLSQSVTYVGPVDVGATVRAECAVVESLGADRYRLSTTVESGGETVVEGEATVLADDVPSSA